MKTRQPVSRMSSHVNALPRLKTWVIAACLGLVASSSAFAVKAGPMNFWGNYTNASAAAVDPTKPVQAGRSYFTTSVEEIPGGARLTVEMYHGDLNTPVSTTLQVAINDGKGKVVAIPIQQLDVSVKDNPKLYYSKRTYDLDYKDLNKKLKALLPASAAKNIEIGPGSALFVLGEWTAYGHTWGGIGRGGIFFMPEDPNATSSSATTANSRRPEELDLAYPIPQTMAMTYNTVTKGGKVSGLEVGGQIRSRVESEGKYQVPLHETKAVKKRLFELANNPKEAAKVFGADWTITAMMKYMKKDKSGNYILDADGLPTPDPMVDTYYDNSDLDAAKNDIAIRYRWTEGNGTGAWNIKPGLTNASPDGIVDRIEFGVDSTDDKPGTIKKFADSMDPLNPFKTIREVVKGAVPSEFLKPSVKVTDTRFKFEFKHKNGLLFEVSLDEVLATSLRGKKAAKGRYCQLEADIDHLSTASANVAALSPAFTNNNSTLDATQKAFLKGLGKDALLDGRPVMHTIEDLDARSPVKIKHVDDFKLASEAIVYLRDDLFGSDWISGPQKYALAAEVLDMVTKTEASGSVKKMVKDEKDRRNKGEPARRISRRFGSGCAAGAFGP